MKLSFDFVKRRPNRYFFIALLVMLIDQGLKVWVKFNMVLNSPGGKDDILIFGNVFKLHFTENKGMAFGLTLKNIFPALSEDVAKVVLTIFSVLAIFLIVYLLINAAKIKSWLPVLIAFILGGAVGNMIDRLFYGVWFCESNNYECAWLQGRVVDMFYLDVWKGTMPHWIPFFGGEYYAFWPIFNIADAAIFTSIFTILIFQKKFFKLHEPETESTEETNSTEVNNAVDIKDPIKSADPEDLSKPNSEEKENDQPDTSLPDNSDEKSE